MKNKFKLVYHYLRHDVRFLNGCKYIKLFLNDTEIETFGGYTDFGEIKAMAYIEGFRRGNKLTEMNLDEGIEEVQVTDVEP